MATTNYPLVSVIIPMYNAEAYALDAIQSILNQTYTNLEVIVIDDCSTDNSYDIINNIKDNRIKLYKNDQNLKISKTLNKAISYASGAFIARMDADDISLPERIEKQVNYLTEHEDIDFCGTFIKFFDRDTKTPSYYSHFKDIKDNILIGNPFAHPTTMFKSRISNDLYYIDEYATAEDIELFSRLLKLGYKGTNISEILLLYRITGNQTIFKKDVNNNIVKNKEQDKLSYSIRLENLRYAYPTNFSYKNIKICEKLLLTKEPIESINDLNTLANYITALDKKRHLNFYSKKAFINIFYYKVLIFLKLNLIKHLVLILTRPSILFLFLKYKI